MRNLFSKPMGALGAPIGAHDHKNIAPAVLAGIIAGGSALLGTIGSTISQANTNNANRDIARDTNEANMAINEQQLQWARENYELQKYENRYLVDQAYKRELENRYYNSPVNQVELYRNAGLNPALMMHGNGSLSSPSVGSTMGSAPKVDSPSLIPAQTGAPMQALKFDISRDAAMFGEMLTDLSFRREQMDQRWIEILKDAPLDPETKDKMLKRKYFEGDKTAQASSGVVQEAYQEIINKVALQTFELNIQQEKNDQLRKEWQYLNKHHQQELSMLFNQVLNIIEERKLLKDKHTLNEKAMEVIDEELRQFARANNLWNGDFSWRAFIEVIQKIFGGSALAGLIGAMIK